MSLLSTLSFRIVESSEAALRLERAHAWLLEHGGRGAILVGASRGAADDLARAVARARGGALGLHRFSFTQLAAHLAAPVLAARGAVPVTRVGTEAVAARATFEARHDGELSYFAPVASTPGFPRALARTLNELALARVGPEALRQLPLGGPDLAALFERFDAQFAAASATDRATLFEAAAQGADGVPRHAAPAPRRPAPVHRRALVCAAADRERRSRARAGAVRRPGHARSSENARRRARGPGAGGQLRPHRAAPQPVFATAAARAGADRRGSRLLGARREPRVRRDRAPDPAGSSRRRALRRDRGGAAGAGRLRRPARGRLRSCRHSRLVRARRAPAASRGTCVPRHPRLRARTAVGDPVRGIPVARTGPERRRGGAHAGDVVAGRRCGGRLRARRAAAGRGRGRRGGTTGRQTATRNRSWPVRCAHHGAGKS